MRRNNHFPRRPRTSIDGHTIFFVLVAAIVLALAVGYFAFGWSPGNTVECRGTTAVYREYDAWAERYETYAVPNDPACSGRG